MARINSKGDNGSPCLSPLACAMFRLGVPFIRIFDEEDLSKSDIQSCHLVLKPSAANTSSKNCHPTESKTLEMSNLIKRADCFFL
jgi:hypothetical protein